VRAAGVIPRDDRIDGTAARSLLVVETWNIGDVVLALPFLAELRSLFPGAWITFLGRPHAAQVLRGCALVDEVITVDLPWTAAKTYDLRAYDFARMKTTFRELRSRRFDVGFESRMDPRGKLILALCGARRRVGLAYGGANWLLTDAVPVGNVRRHKNDDWMDLLRPFGGPVGAESPGLAISDEEARQVGNWLRASGVEPGERIVAVHPGASSQSKRWPVERFVEVARAVAARPGVRVVGIRDPSGAGSELAVVPGIVMASLDLRQLMALLARCELLVCNDSGPMHLAAGLGTRVVGIFHLHAAREFAPLGESHDVLRPVDGVDGPVPPPADRLLSISVARVLAAVEKALDRGRR
jgi:heptosyltransferase II